MISKKKAEKEEGGGLERNQRISRNPELDEYLFFSLKLNNNQFVTWQLQWMNLVCMLCCVEMSVCIIILSHSTLWFLRVYIGILSSLFLMNESNISNNGLSSTHSPPTHPYWVIWVLCCDYITFSLSNFISSPNVQIKYTIRI